MLWVFDTVWALVLPAILLWTGLSARMRDWSARVGRRWFFVIAIYWIVFTILTTAVDLPRVYYESFMRQHAYGLSNQTLGKWASDQAANLGVTLVIGALFLWVPYLLLERSPRRWWLYTTMLAVPFILLVQLVTAALDRSALQPVRSDEGQGARSADSAPRRPRGHRRRPRVRSGEERGHQGGQCLCERIRRHQAHRAVGHDPEGARSAAADDRDGARDGALRATAPGRPASRWSTPTGSGSPPRRASGEAHIDSRNSTFGFFSMV